MRLRGIGGIDMNSEDVMDSFFYRIPYINENKCFYCNQPIKAMKRAEFYGFSNELGKQIVSCEFEYCRYCDLIQMSKETYGRIRSKGFDLGVIKSFLGLPLITLKRRMFIEYKNDSSKRKRKVGRQYTINRKGTICIDIPSKHSSFNLDAYSTAESEIKNSIKKIYTIKSREYRHIHYCSVCGRDLLYSYTFVPINNKEAIKVYGKICPHCNYLYTNYSNKLLEIFIDNTFAENYYLNGKSYANYTEETLLESFQKNYQSTIFIYHLKNGNNSFYIAILENEEEENTEKNVYYYMHPIAREVLAAAMIREKYNWADINEKRYTVSCIMKKEVKYIPPYITLIDDEKFKRLIKKDVLLYSPITKKFEIIKIAMGEYGECYLGISYFRRFVKYYGKPRVDIIIDESSYKNSDRVMYSELRDKSILKLFGYSVSEKDKLGSKFRQSILCDIVDLELMTVKQVVSLLGFFIDTHTNDKYFYARAKWQEDLNFMTNYRTNPDRFLIFESNT